MCYCVYTLRYILTLEIDRDFVLSQARSLDQVPYEERGPLHGLAIGVKDIMNTKGITHGSLDQ